MNDLLVGCVCRWLVCWLCWLFGGCAYAGCPSYPAHLHFPNSATRPPVKFSHGTEEIRHWADVGIHTAKTQSTASARY